LQIRPVGVFALELLTIPVEELFCLRAVPNSPDTSISSKSFCPGSNREPVYRGQPPPPAIIISCSSLKRIRDLDAKFVIPAHGRTFSPSTVDDNLVYFEELANRVRNLSESQLADPELSKPSGLRLQDIVPIPEDLPVHVFEFYEKCHETNLGATVQTCVERQP
jgi:hypothetical protein